MSEAVDVQLRTMTSRLGNIMDRTDALEVRVRDMSLYLVEAERKILDELEALRSDMVNMGLKSNYMMANVVQRIDTIGDKIKQININL